jgi:hypothetical protein
LEFDIPHKSLVDASANPAILKLQVYAPSEQIRKFAEADITNQQFIDNCVVIADGNRIQVPLAGGGGAN